MDLPELIQSIKLDAGQYLAEMTRITNAVWKLNVSMEAKGLGAQADKLNAQYNYMMKINNALERTIELQKELDKMSPGYTQREVGKRNYDQMMENLDRQRASLSLQAANAVPGRGRASRLIPSNLSQGGLDMLAQLGVGAPKTQEEIDQILDRQLGQAYLGQGFKGGIGKIPYVTAVPEKESPTVTAAGGGISSILGRLGSGFMAFGEFRRGLDLMVQGVSQVTTSFVTGMTEVTTGAVRGFHRAATGFVTGISDIVNGMISGKLAQGIFTGLGSMISGALTGAGGAVGDAITGMTKMIGGSISGLGKMIAGGIMMFGGIAAGAFLLTGIGAPAAALTIVVTTLTAKVVEMVSDILGGIIGGIGKVIGTIISGIASTLGDILKSMFGTAGNVVQAGIGVGMQVEKTTDDFTVLTGSATKARDVFSQIQDMSIFSPYAVSQLTDVAKLLLSSGMSANNLVPTISRLGNVAMGDFGRLQKLAQMLITISRAGTMNLNDVRSLQGLGISPADLAQTMGISPQALVGLSRAGAVPGQVLQDTINRMTGEGGQFGKPNIDTVSGAWAQLENVVESTVQKMSRAFLNGAGFVDMLKSASAWLTEQVPMLESISEIVGEAVTEMFKALGSLGIAGVNTGAGMLGGMFGDLANVDWSQLFETVIDKSIDAFEMVATGAANLASLFADVIDVVATMAGAVKIFIETIELSSRVFTTLINTIPGAGPVIKAAFGGGIFDFIMRGSHNVGQEMLPDWVKNAQGYMRGASGLVGAGFNDLRSNLAEARANRAMTEGGRDFVGPMPQENAKMDIDYYAQYEQYKKIAGGYQNYAEHLSPAADFGSSAAVDIINKAQFQTGSVQEEILKTLQIANVIAQGRAEHEKKVVEEMQKAPVVRMVGPK